MKGITYDIWARINSKTTKYVVTAWAEKGGKKDVAEFKTRGEADAFIRGINYQGRLVVDILNAL